MDERLHRALADEQFDAAVDALAAIEMERELCPHELVLKARCLQLHPLAERRFLEEAKKALLKALERDPESVPALVEFGWLLLNVEGKPIDALAAFDKAFHQAARIAAESLSGISRSIEETQSKNAVVNVLEERMAFAAGLLNEERRRLGANNL